MNLKISLLFLFLFKLLPIQGHQIGFANHPNPVNNYISFANESTHGMLIAHRILEGFNQKVNAFVDLQSNQFNFYGNKDLPKDLFEDPEKWFYQISPNQWYSIIKTTPWESPYKKQLDNLAAEMRLITQTINEKRFSMEEFMLQNDLTLVKNQVSIFAQLEHCASLYDRYYEVNDQLNNLVTAMETAYQNKSQQGQNFSNIQQSLKRSLEKIRYGFDRELDDEISILTTENNILQKQVVRDEALRQMQTALNEGLQIIKDYKSQKPIPEKYTLYGPAYYYYNVELAAIMNRYGKGFVANANKILISENQQQILLLEEPHYFKVVLPKKVIPLEESKEIITALPSILEEREVAISQTKIEVKQKKLLLEIFDHRQEDGDIISLNFNGRWILQKKKLLKTPLKIIVELNDAGENYLLLHAENLGEVPPNTIAIRYYLEGIRKTVVLNSDLNQSEMIRIKRIADDE